MLTISQRSLAALQAEHDRGAPLRFHAWWSAYDALLGPRDAFSLGTLLDRYRDEFAITGLREERQFFLFCAARARMPDMGDRQYLAVLDVIVGRQNDRDRLVAIGNVAQTVPADD